MNECGELCRSRTETISETDDCTVKQFTGENGQYLMTTYRIFPGVEFITEYLRSPTVVKAVWNAALTVNSGICHRATL